MKKKSIESKLPGVNNGLRLVPLPQGRLERGTTYSMKNISLFLSPLNFKGLVEDIQQTIVKFGLELRREVGARNPL